MEVMQISDKSWKSMSEYAWKCRNNARILGATKVGAAALAADGSIFAGCNVEHKFRSHDIHAETSAISSLVASGKKALIAILVVAEREKFTPCGGCMDWIFELGGPDCIVGFQNKANGEIKKYKASELMPFYPS